MKDKNRYQKIAENMALWTSIRTLVDLDETLEDRGSESKPQSQGIRRWLRGFKFRK